jgi:hypothetical protein
MRNAGLYLRYLLSDSYRQRWDRPDYVERSRQGDVHHGAVAQVLAAYIRHHPRRPEDRDIMGGQLAPLVSRALRGEKLSQPTMRVFIAAFGMADEHAESLWRQLAGQEPGRVILGSLPPNDFEGARPYEILMLHEHHWLGPDGFPARHRTQVNIRSGMDGLRSYKYLFDTNVADVRTPRTRGMAIGDRREIQDGLFAVEINFDRPLRRGEDEYLEFWTIFRYQEPPRPELRRAVHGRIDDVYLRVHFHENKAPQEVWWAEWLNYTGADDRLIEREVYRLDERLFVHRHLKSLQQAVAGFTWTW